jgi:hypothetical protein
MKALAWIACLATASAADFERELSADRPDATESPYTVEPGRFQVETSLWAFSRDREAGVETRTWSVAETNFKIGLAADHDLQLVLRPWVRESLRGLGRGEAEGFGDIELRWKWNLWGNAGGRTALGVMPFVSVPTRTAVSSGEWEGGVILTWATELPAGWGLGVQGEVDRGWDDASRRHEWDFLHTLVIGRDLTERAGIYLEYIGVAGAHPYEASLSGGLTVAIGADLQLDLGGTYGLNDAAEDFSIFQGFTYRF